MNIQVNSSHLTYATVEYNVLHICREISSHTKINLFLLFHCPEYSSSL